MKPARQRKATAAEYAGRALGRLCRVLLQLDLRCQRWLVAHGMAPGAAAAVTLVCKVAVVGGFLYAALWLTLSLALLIAAAWVVRDATLDADEERQPEWREGHGGFGLYDREEWRHDMGDPSR